MLKKFCSGLFLVFALAVQAAELPRLYLGNAANGAPVNVLQHEALKLAFSGKYEVAAKHLKPSAALEALRRGEVDLLIIDTRFLPEKTSGLKIHPYAAEALCIYIHPGNQLGSLTKAEVKKILTDLNPNWRDYNGAATDIQRIMLKSGTPGATLTNRVLGNIDTAAAIFRVSNLEQLFSFLNPAAAGFGPFQPERRAEIIAVPVDDVTPSTQTVVSGQYPLTVQYALVHRTNETSEAVQKLLAAVSAPESLDALKTFDMIPLWKE